MNKEKRKIVTTWGIAALIFFVIFVVSIAFLFAPVKEVNEEVIVTHPAISVLGGKMLSESWKRYPQYTIGLGVAGLLGAIGGCYSIYLIYKKGDIGNEEED